MYLLPGVLDIAKNVILLIRYKRDFSQSQSWSWCSLCRQGEDDKVVDQDQDQDQASRSKWVGETDYGDLKISKLRLVFSFLGSDWQDDLPNCRLFLWINLSLMLVADIWNNWFGQKLKLWGFLFRMIFLTLPFAKHHCTPITLPPITFPQPQGREGFKKERPFCCSLDY